MPTSITVSPQDGSQVVLEKLYSKAAWRLLPLLFLLYVLAHIDRVNIGFAKLQMAEALNFSDTVYGLGAGIFFLGYFLFEVPSNIFLERVGARRWIARILIFWGPLSAATAFVETATGFYVLRFLLGVGEAGLFPGIILYLTYWFPAKVRAKYLALFMLAIPIAGMVTGPISGFIMTKFHGDLGLDGWQWMFLLEGAPAVLLGIYVLFRLDDGPKNARWLSLDERRALALALERAKLSAAEDAGPAMNPRQKIKLVLTSARTWMLATIYFLMIIGSSGLAFWLPQIIQDLRQSSVQAVGLLSAIPFAGAIISMIVISAHSDRTSERKYHLCSVLLTGFLGFTASAVFIDKPLLALIGLCLATAGFLSAFPLFWAMITGLVAPAGLAISIAFINSFGNLGGAFAPVLVGYVKQHLGLAACLYLLGSVLLAAGSMVVLSKNLEPETIPQESTAG